jgi:hypothetical protein
MATSMLKNIEALERLCERLRKLSAEALIDVGKKKALLEKFPVVKEYRATLAKLIDLKAKHQGRFDDERFQQAVLDEIEAADPGARDRIIKRLQELDAAGDLEDHEGSGTG